ncbi:hypothetical protein [Streptomyces cucumeris]|uniref:hypothetical protein n=1 Tax=Streptomyces cucumeris TaxID=2962890 RepID=UPI0020C8A9B2|nr:hypothetical protein [Streptomyces sp. NEAU-Y11]MCP9209968.1 hypothetical protein [Streptomyces sp. NEAU-Y11]
MNFTHNVVSLGGVTVGLSIAAWNITCWWTGHKKRNLAALKDLVPFAITALYGMLLILSAGGMLGGGADIGLWGSSAIGDAALKHGVGGDSPNVTRHSNLVLSDGGHAVVIIATVVLVAVWTRKKGFRWDIFFNLICGISLGLSSGVAGAAGFVLSPVVSTAGDWTVGLL